MPDQQYREEPCKYVYQVTLTALQNLTDLSIFIESDADFALTDIYGKFAGGATVNFKTPSGRFVYSAAVLAQNSIGSAQFPVPVVPAMLYPAGSKLGFTLTDTSNANNAVELVFSGVRRVPIR